MRTLIRYTGRIMVMLIGLALILGVAIVGLIPALLGYDTRVVTTQSMAAANMSAGSLIVTQRVDAKEIRIGDIVTYQEHSGEEATVTHRVVGLSTASDGSTRWQTKGDSNPKADPAPVRKEQIVGRLVVWDVPAIDTTPYIVPLAGWIVLMPLWQRLGIGLGVIIVFVLIPGIRAKRVAREEQRQAANSPVALRQ